MVVTTGRIPTARIAIPATILERFRLAAPFFLMPLNPRRAATIKPLPVRCLQLLLPISHGRRTHRTKAVKLLNFDVVGPCGLVCHRRRRVHQLLTRLSLLARWLGSLLRRQRLLIDVELLLFPDVDLVLCRCGKHVIPFPIVFHGRDPVLGKSIDRLLLLGVVTVMTLKPDCASKDSFWATTWPVPVV